MRWKFIYCGYPAVWAYRRDFTDRGEWPPWFEQWWWEFVKREEIPINPTDEHALQLVEWEFVDK